MWCFITLDKDKSFFEDYFLMSLLDNTCGIGGKAFIIPEVSWESGEQCCVSRLLRAVEMRCFLSVGCSAPMLGRLLCPFVKRGNTKMIAFSKEWY